MKFDATCEAIIAKLSRSPCGERGLKFRNAQNAAKDPLSLPVRGAWVEMWISTAIVTVMDCVAPRAGSVG